MTSLAYASHLRFTSLRLPFKVFTAVALEGRRTVFVCNCWVYGPNRAWRRRGPPISGST